MATENDGGAPNPHEAPSSDEDAFAQTVAPTASQPTPPMRPSKAPAGTRPVTGAEATVAADLAGELPPLPEVSAALYQTGDEIARGGMGRIVAAEDLRLGRKVALKELLDSAGDQTTRFQREALITARLQHPGIVPVYEAGRWPTGEPFFAMKLVAGKPLDQVIAATRSLDQRLALLPRLVAACDAIAYAHSQRIIHRDLKPGNILIGDFGESVVIDWGLAKDLDAIESPESANRAAPRRPSQKTMSAKSTASSTLTVAGAVMGTPAYMAPEQARGEPVDQRADVFALGAMLYHVLAGAPPYNARTATDVIAAAALGKVVPLADREKRAPRELVAIVTRAMAPLQVDRYPDAGVFAEELRRFMTGRLVDAHRYTALQRLGRFVKRHRGAVTVATIALLGFIIGGTVAVHRIVAARDQAEYQQHIASTRGVAAERLIDYMMTHVQRQLTQIGRLDLMAGLSTEVKRYYDKLSQIPGSMPDEDEGRMAEAIELIGRAEHQSGKPDEALATWGEARTKLVGLIGTDHGPRTLRLRAMIAKLDYESGTVFLERGKYERATNYFAEAGHEYDELRKEAPGDRALMLGAADNDDELGDMLRREGKLDEAFEQYTSAKALRDQAQGNGRVTDEVMALSTSHLKLGSIYQSRGESSVAADEYKASLKLRDSLLATEPDNAQVQKAVLDTLEQLAIVETMLGDDAASIAMFQRALPVTQLLAQRDPTNIDWEYQRGNVLADLGQSFVQTGRFQDGLEQIERAVDVDRGLSARDPEELALSRRTRARARSRRRRTPRARQDRRRAGAVQGIGRCTVRAGDRGSDERRVQAVVRQLLPEARRGVRREGRHRESDRAARASADDPRQARRRSAVAGRLQERAGLDRDRARQAPGLARSQARRRADRVGPHPCAGADRERSERDRVEADADPGPARARADRRRGGSQGLVRRSPRDGRRRGRTIAAERDLAGLSRRGGDRARRRREGAGRARATREGGPLAGGPVAAPALALCELGDDLRTEVDAARQLDARQLREHAQRAGVRQLEWLPAELVDGQRGHPDERACACERGRIVVVEAIHRQREVIELARAARERVTDLGDRE